MKEEDGTSQEDLDCFVKNPVSPILDCPPRRNRNPGRKRSHEFSCIIRNIETPDCSEEFIDLNFQVSSYKLERASRNVPMTTSLKVAEVFGKMHKNVLRDIEALDCSEEFRRLNFELTEMEIQAGPVKRMSKVYLMTRDGFTFLAMGFTGARAAEFKEKYIAEFNLMEAKTFGKEHKHVMNDIRKLTDKGLLNFQQTLYTHPQNGQEYRMFLMDRDGFTLLAMGFTGEAASSAIIWNYSKVTNRYF